MSLLQNIRCEWWQFGLLILAIRMSPLVMALATILVARFVRPELAKIALPLILAPSPSVVKKLGTLLPRSFEKEVKP